MEVILCAILWLCRIARRSIVDAIRCNDGVSFGVSSSIVRSHEWGWLSTFIKWHDGGRVPSWRPKFVQVATHRRRRENRQWNGRNGTTFIAEKSRGEGSESVFLSNDTRGRKKKSSNRETGEGSSRTIRVSPLLLLLPFSLQSFFSIPSRRNALTR